MSCLLSLYKERIESGEWGCTKAVGTAMCRGVYSRVRDSANVWMPLDV